jgi:hypothetical protein
MLIRTSIALAAIAFLGFASVAQAGDSESQYRQQEGFSFDIGPQGQYFGSRAPQPGYYGYGYSPYGYVQPSHRRHYAR